MQKTYLGALAKRALDSTDIAVSALLGGLPNDAEHLEQVLASREPLQLQLATLLDYPPTAWLVECELEEVGLRRGRLGIDGIAGDNDPLRRAYESRLIGVALSGGGIRSASFNLGLLQALADVGLLRQIDYLSSVSGGGYIHQWLAAWLRRLSPELDDGATQATLKEVEQSKEALEKVEESLIPTSESSRSDEVQEIGWLRRYSNYLTPKRGFFTADTWVGAAIWIQNTLLNQIVLIAGLFLLLLVPHLLAPPAGVAANAAPLMPSEITVVNRFVALFVLALFAMVGLVAAANLSGADSSRARLLDDRGVQWTLVLPLLSWALLVTLLQEVMSPVARPTVLLIATGVIGGSFMAAVIAFRGGAIEAFKKNRGTKIAIPALALPITGVLGVAVAAAVVGSLWSMLVPPVAAGILAGIVPVEESRLRLMLGPPLVLLGPMLAVVVLVGLLGRMYHDHRREWLSRLTAWGGIYAMAWTAYAGIAFAARPAVDWLIANAAAGVPSLAGWIGMTTAGVLAGRSVQTATGEDSASNARAMKEWLAALAPYVFALGLLLLVGWGAERAFVAAGEFGPLGFLPLFAAPLILCLIFGWRVDVNAFSMHAFYRNRLARAYLAASNQKGRTANPFTTIDPRDAKVPLSELRASRNYPGPFPIFCAALNLSGGSELAWQERKAASFAFTPLYSGYDTPLSSQCTSGRRPLRLSGFVKTEQYAFSKPGISIATVAAISGAAASPNQGYHTNPVTAFLMTVFNVRLGWWLLNPRVVREDGTLVESTGDVRPWPTPRFAVSELVKELLGSVDDTRRYVYLTDGGHFDNMGLYELVRRRCRYIIISDAEEDSRMGFGGIAAAIRKCRADFGVEIDLDVRALDRDPSTGLSDRHVVVGSIRYPGSKPKKEDEKEEVGRIVYLKASLTGDEPADLVGYKRANGQFPHQSTMDQWFSESQFESYRRLGQHIGETVMGPVKEKSPNYSTLSTRKKLFESLFDIWHPATPEMVKFQAAHAARYNELMAQLRNEPRLAGLHDTLHGHADAKWMIGRNPADLQFAIHFTAEMLDFMWTVYTDLKLVYPSKASHPHSRGWVELFKKCAKVDLVQEGWRRYGPTYSHQFQHFAITEVGLPSVEPQPDTAPPAPVLPV